MWKKKDIVLRGILAVKTIMIIKDTRPVPVTKDCSEKLVIMTTVDIKLDTDLQACSATNITRIKNDKSMQLVGVLKFL